MSGFLGRFSGQHEVQELLNAQATHLVRAAKVLAEMVSADSHSRTELNEKLHEIENDADTASHQVLKEVGSRFVLPYDRGDLRDCRPELVRGADDRVLKLEDIRVFEKQ